MARSPTASASALHDALAEVRQILTDTDQVSAGKFFADDKGTSKAPMAGEGDGGGGEGPGATARSSGGSRTTGSRASTSPSPR